MHVAFPELDSRLSAAHLEFSEIQTLQWKMHIAFLEFDSRLSAAHIETSEIQTLQYKIHICHHFGSSVEL